MRPATPPPPSALPDSPIPPPRPAPDASGRAARLALAVLLVGGVLTGFAPILVRLSADAGVGPQAAAFWRFALAIPFTAAWALADMRRALGQSDARGSGANTKLLILAGLLFAGDLATWHAGIVRTDVANATLLPNLTPILVGLAAWFLFKERPSRRFVAGAAAALIGAVLLSGAGLAGAAEEGRADRALGDLLSLLTAFWYAAYMLAVKAARDRGASTGVLMLWVSVVGAAVLLPVSLIAGDALTPADPRGWLYLAALAVLVHVGGQGAIAFALGRLPAGFSALMILVQPVVAALAAWALFGEALGALQLAGGALVLAGVWHVARRRRADG